MACVGFSQNWVVRHGVCVFRLLVGQLGYTKLNFIVIACNLSQTLFHYLTFMDTLITIISYHIGQGAKRREIKGVGKRRGQKAWQKGVRELWRAQKAWGKKAYIKGVRGIVIWLL